MKRTGAFQQLQRHVGFRHDGLHRVRRRIDQVTIDTMIRLRSHEPSSLSFAQYALFTSDQSTVLCLHSYAHTSVHSFVYKYSFSGRLLAKRKEVAHADSGSMRARQEIIIFYLPCEQKLVGTE